MAGLRGLAGDTVWYGLSSIIGRLISYFMTPLYTYVFLPGEYGIFTETYAYMAFFFVLYTYGIETAYFRFATKEHDKEKKYFNLTVSVLITTSLIFSSILYITAKDITIWLGYPGKEIIVYWLSTVLAIDTIVSIPFARLRLKKRPIKFAIIRLTNVTLSVLMNIFFFVFCYQIISENWLPSLKPLIASFYDVDFKVKYIFLSNLIANATLLILLFKEFKGFRYTISFKELKPILVYALPLLLMGLGGVTNEMLSRALLKEWLPENFYPGQSSLAALGVFGACYKLSVFMLLGIQAFRYAAEPFFFSKAAEKNSPQLFAKIMSGFVVFNSIVYLAVSVNLEPIGLLFLMNPAYREGLYIVPFLLLGYFFYGVYYNISVWYKVTDRTHFGAIITGVGAIITVILNYLLIPVYGYFGSALVTLITFFVMVVINYWIGQKYYPIPYQVPKAIEYVLISTLLIIAFYNLDLGHWFVNFIVRNSSVVAFILYVYFRERKNISGVILFGFKIP